jgi:hypothetical protein
MPFEHTSIMIVIGYLPQLLAAYEGYFRKKIG